MTFLEYLFIYHIILLRCVIFVWSNQACDVAEECIGQILNDPGTTRARAYKAAFGSSTSFTGGEIQCSGSFSCHLISFIKANTKVICRGRDSCSNTTIELTSSNNIDCHGSNSCSFSNITATNVSMLICNGYLSCRNTYIYSVDTVDASGSLSLYKAIIDSNGIIGNTINVFLGGSLAGYGAKLICRQNHICNIHCRAFDSCFMFYTECIGECVVTTSSDSFISPTTNLTHFNDIIPKFFENQAVVPTNDAVCTMDSWNFDDYEEQKGASDITVNDEGPVCCRGRSSCYDINAISFNTKTYNDLICGGYSGCRTSNIMSNNGTVYCEGLSACYGSSISDAYDVYCVGGWSCVEANITNVHHVLCSGSTACNKAAFISGGSSLNVYFVARATGLDATLYCNDTDSCNIYCNGYRSCEQLILFCAQNCNVECDAIESECPIIVYRSNASTETPIAVPTTFPSINPSQNPSETLLSYTSNPTAIVTTNVMNEQSTMSSTDQLISSDLMATTRYPSQNPSQTPLSTPSNIILIAGINDLPVTSTLNPISTDSVTVIYGTSRSSEHTSSKWIVVIVIIAITVISIVTVISILVYHRNTLCFSQWSTTTQNHKMELQLSHVNNIAPSVAVVSVSVVTCVQCGAKSSQPSLLVDEEFVCALCIRLGDESMDKEVDKMFSQNNNNDNDNEETAGYTAGHNTDNDNEVVITPGISPIYNTDCGKRDANTVISVGESGM